ncbi:MAG: bifunctional phosphoribosyl-AMP cyclohydrolase/phosphoribosyl-ATP diphosphatase HisIE [Candidatus Micrarchaeota archaeon]
MKITKARAEKIACKIDFGKCRGLVPAIAQAADGEVLMLAFMSREALVRTLTTGKMWYYSRSRRKLWRKGETSGNEQLVEKLYIDCDNDALLFRVRQIGSACHTGKSNCFGTPRKFSLEELFRVIWERRKNPRKNSYTNKLLRDEDRIYGKIEEESNELIEVARGGKKKEIIWEAGDVLYHLLVLLARKNVKLGEVLAELERRRTAKKAGDR